MSPTLNLAMTPHGWRATSDVYELFYFKLISHPITGQNTRTHARSDNDEQAALCVV